MARKNEAMEVAVKAFLAQRAAEKRDSNEAFVNRRVANSMARETVFQEDLEDVLSRVFSKPIVRPEGFAKRKAAKKPAKRILNLALSDLHFHSLLNAREVPTPFGPKEEARRLAYVVSEAAEYKTHYRDHTELYVHIFGDIILGELHDPREGANLTDQFAAATYYFIQAISFLSAHFPKVTVRCVPGNHGRRKSRHHDRATSEKWDSYENMIYFATKMGVAPLKNVTVEIPYTPFYTYKAFGKTGFVTHGDTVLDVGFPSDTISIKKIRGQINEFNAGDVKSDLFMVGHVHTGSMVEIPSGPTLISNGALIPPDPYCISRGTFHTNCGQQLFESVEKYICGDRRFLNVGRAQDEDSSLDDIIKPYGGFTTNSPLGK
jgi:hypothetical protein